ncbi:MAG: metallophosphoesterase [Saprospiraceae bacterium]|nr:metallophosphoesterase [Saprospiraceae bacterium]
MRNIKSYENQHLSLLKSAVFEQLKSKDWDPKQADVIIRGVDQYCESVLKNEEIKKPPANYQNTWDPWIATYLMYLHHHKAHAKIADNKQAEKALEEQLASFKFDNPGWQVMFDQYVKYYWKYPHHEGGKPYYRSWQDTAYGACDYNYGVVKWEIPSNATIAIIGDIGTGTDVAAAVLIGLLSFKPDVILHVGDVYYSGTEHEFEHYFIGLLKSVFKDQGTEVPVYTLPGNHEYFTGAIPYFECLDSNALVQSEAQRQQASFFKLVTEDRGWQFLGMDTGYHGHFMGVKGDKLEKALEALHVDSSKAYMPVTPPDMVYVRPDEVDWHHYHLNQFQGKSVLLGHHQLYSANQTVGVAQKYINGKPDPHDMNRIGVNTRLWQAFGQYFNKVAVWFWGHEHNLGIYQDNFRPNGGLNLPTHLTTSLRPW